MKIESSNYGLAVLILGCASEHLSDCYLMLKTKRRDVDLCWIRAHHTSKEDRTNILAFTFIPTFITAHTEIYWSAGSTYKLGIIYPSKTLLLTSKDTLRRLPSVSLFKNAFALIQNNAHQFKSDLTRLPLTRGFQLAMKHKPF